MKIYIVRHGETDLNSEKRCMGQRIDQELNSTGIKQAEELASKLDTFDLIFTSPLKRAVQTAEIISKKIGDVEILKRSELLERDFGSLSGKTWEERSAEAGKTNLKELDLGQEYDYREFEGECVEDVKKRFLKLIEELKSKHSDKKILIVAHGGILKLAHLLFLEEKPNHTPENASIHEFDI